MLDFTLENISSEEVERLRAVYGPLAESVRELIDATVRTEMDADAVAAAKAEIDSATARLRQKQTDGMGKRRRRAAQPDCAAGGDPSRRHR